MDRGAWILELYAWFHSTPNLELLRVTRTFDLEQVAMRLQSRRYRSLGHPIPILGHGTVHSSEFSVPNVRYAPGTTYNVISAPHLAREHGLQTVFEEQLCYIVDPVTGDIVGRGHLLEYMWGMYQLDYLRIEMAKVRKQKQQGPTSSLVQKIARRMGCWTGASLSDLLWQQYEERRYLDESLREGLSFDISPGLVGDHSSAAMERGGTSEGLATEQAAGEWVLDCFAGHHATSNLLVMYNLSSHDDEQEQVHRVRGRFIPWRGSVRTTSFHIPNVAYVPRYAAAGDAASDVISVAQLASDHGLVTVFEPTGCYIRDPAGKKDVGRARLRGGTYVLEYLHIGQAQDDTHARLLPTSGEGPGHGQQVCDERHALSSHSQQPVLARQQSTYTLTEWPDDDKFGLLRFERSGGGDVPSKVPVRVGPAFAYSHPVVASGFNRDVYVMDSGASFHMTPDMNLLHSYMRRDDGMFPCHFPAEIYVGDGVRLPVRGIGNIETGAIRLEDVLHIEGLVANLVSVSQLTHQLTNQLVDHLGKAARQLHPVGVLFRLNDFAINVGQAEVGHGTSRVDQVYHLGALSEFPTND